MPLSRKLLTLAPLTLVVVAAISACDDDNSTAPEPERYVLALTGVAERPNPVTTTASGSAVITVLNKDSVEFLMYVSGDSITASHIHAGDANAAGPIMVFTFGGPVTGRIDGAFRHGFLTRSGTFSGAFSMDSLLSRMRAGTAYLNVHTRRFPGGELRGQIVR
ncbi:MAG: CHRD domain-containing protein [Gemmatimonadaceae bacterium]|nr:CHRD domain-containing protein [Gemmatimonadaceae bacterium]